MWLVLSALRRPITVLVAVLAVLLGSYLAITRMKKDIFPQVGSPTIYVAQPYGGMDPSQMEGFLTYYYEYHFLYITGIEHVESKSIQGAALMKLVFHEGTDMNQAMAETVGYVNRSRAFMPPGAVPPFITRFDAGSVPVGQLVFTSPNRTPGEMQDFALNRVRPLFATLPGVSAPPPFGGNQRTIVVRANPDKLREYHLSPEDVVNAVNRASVVLPSGNVRIGDLNRIANTNSVIGGNLQELADAPVRTGNGATVYIRDVAVVESGTDIVSGYAHSNGKRTVYINVTKRADASTLDVINAVKANLNRFRAVVPEDVKIDLVFDQSSYVTDALRALVSEGLLGALLTGLMVLLFLRDWRSALIVVATIPFALLGAVLGLWAVGQTINIMTLAGLALAVGVLVDEATVEIENIHSHLAEGLSRPRAVLDAASKTAVPRLLSMLSILAVFVPAFFMTGVARQLFVPLALAVGFAMIASYILSTTLVPVLSVWVMRHGRGEQEQAFLRRAYTGYLNTVVQLRYLVFLAYAGGVVLLLWLLVPRLGTEFFPTVDSGQFQIRLRAPTGTRVEKTELETLKALDVIRQTVEPDNIAISTAFIGVQPASYPINTVHLWTNGPQEAVLKVALKMGTPVPKEKIREALRKSLPHLKLSFEAADIISQVMSFGSPTPIEVAVQGPQIAAARPHAERIRAELAKIPYLRDLQMAQALDYPTVDVSVDRERAGQLGLTTQQITKSLVMATSSSRFTDPNYWRDPISGNGFQIQVEIPQHRMQSVQELSEVPILNGTQLRDVAQLKLGTAFGSVERYNMQRVVSFTANVEGRPLGDAEREIRAAIKRAGDPPRGVTVAIRGQIPALDETEAGLRRGLLLSVAVIFLLLAASFQSFRLAFATVLIAPAVVCGAAIVLLLAHTTLNIQSFLGAIMAIGIATANSILMISFMEAARRTGLDHRQAAVQGARSRLRAILMTATAMIAGMMPIALGGAQTAPLGQAVIGGLLFSTIATLTVLPALYAIVQAGAPVHNRSLDPTDPDSRYYEAS
ncbi:MAG: efflux RND transporter permease subunit [Bryobacterales bacterium]|nr:efflux RND transporter permease subunit [Bryobacterales bacterium]